jgi:anti-anti-sigma factor
MRQKDFVNLFISLDEIITSCIWWEMEIKLSFTGETPIFHLVGRLDVTTSPLLEDRLMPLLSVHGQRIVFDCEGLIYVSSAGLRIFISTQRTLSTQGGGVAFCLLTPPVRELFHLAGLEGLFIIEPSLTKAITRLA